MITATICEITREGRILLQKKAAGRFGEGKWNGPGGKVKPDETPEQGVIREVKEETGLTIRDPVLKGLLGFYFGEKEKPDWTAYIYRVTEFIGELNPNEEGELRWFRFEDIPYDEMWEDDIHWLPHLLEGKKVTGTFWYDEKGEELVRHQLKVA
jgi:mutator protein MutT